MGKGFRVAPKPDPAVIALLEHVLESARKGYVRSLAVVAVNPVHQAETAAVGDLSEVRANALLGGLARATAALIGLSNDPKDGPNG